MDVSILLALVPFWPLAAGAALLAFPIRERHRRNVAVFAASALASLLVLGLLWAAPAGPLVLLPFGGGLSIAFRLDSLGRVFLCILALLWPLTDLYAFEYMEGEEHENRFFGFFTLSYGVVLGIALAENLLTLYLFYELLTLCTLPLVMHEGDGKARKAGKKYLLYSMTGAALAFASLCIAAGSGSLSYTLGGSLHAAGNENLLRAAYLLAFFGFGAKAAVFPLQDWLPAAGVAPTPVTALLHAVAVVNSGVFAILRATYYTFGTQLLAGTFAQYIPMGAAVLTLCLGSCLALRQNHLKRRLAYSTVANLSYILFAATLMTPAGLAAALTHMAVHSVVKITLFFCAGAILCRSHHRLDHIFMYEGLARRMPWTFGVFTVASLALIGVPPFAGFGSKMAIARAAVDTGLPLALAGCAGLVFSAFLTGVYQVTVLLPAYWPHEPAPSHEGITDVGQKIKFAYITLTVLALILAFCMDPLLAAMTRAAAGLA